MVLQNNLAAHNAWRMSNNNTGKIAKNLEKLSSGYRVNRAADDAAGLAISEKMRAQIRGLARASLNSLDGISLIQTAEGALSGTHAILQRMRELAVQSANGTNDDPVDRAAINLEFQQLMQEIDDIANITNFNGIYVLKGDYARGPEFEKTNIQYQSINVTHLLGASLPNNAGGVLTTTVDVDGKPVDFRFTLNSNGTVNIRASHAGKILGVETIGQPSLWSGRG